MKAFPGSVSLRVNREYQMFDLKFFVNKNYILILALAISLAWHLLWLSIISISAPKETAPIKFSNVSFLGPILGRGSVEFRTQPKAHSFLEKRYLGKVSDLSYSKESVHLKAADFRYQKPIKAYYSADKDFLNFVDDSLAEPKAHPPVDL